MANIINWGKANVFSLFLAMKILIKYDDTTLKSVRKS